MKNKALWTTIKKHLIQQGLSNKAIAQARQAFLDMENDNLEQDKLLKNCLIVGIAFDAGYDRGWWASYFNRNPADEE